MLNVKFYEAMEQAARGGLVYGHNRAAWVRFADYVPGLPGGGMIDILCDFAIW